MIQAALNGSRTKAEFSGVPLSIDELVSDAVACVAAGAEAIHLHPRDDSGSQTLDPVIVNEVARRVRSASGVPVGMSTGASIEPDLAARLDMIRQWTEPDYTSVNLAEEGSLDVIRTLLEIGIGVEAGLGSVADADLLGSSGFGNRMLRILIEPDEEEIDADATAVLALDADIHAALDHHGITVPRLQHSSDSATWAVLTDALARGLDTRIGLEDTRRNPDGTLTTGNAELVRHAITLSSMNMPNK
jgi:uncharacterized protein (DUF849 family)